MDTDLYGSAPGSDKYAGYAQSISAGGEDDAEGSLSWLRQLPGKTVRRGADVDPALVRPSQGRLGRLPCWR